MRIKFLLFFLLLAVVIQPAAATNYYFSSVSGDDNRTSVEARNPQTPWKSLDKMNIILRSLQPGDSVLLKRGEVFYGTLNLSVSGTQNNPIVFGAYGNGAMPIITSLVDLGEWVKLENGNFEATHTSLGESLNVVLMDGSIQEMGRYPNSNTSNKGYLIFDETNGENSITDDGHPSALNWSGGEVVIRKSRWTIDRHRIISHIGTKITFLPVENTYKPVKNHGYFIQDHINTLDEKGEWYFDAARRKVVLHLGETGAFPPLVQASTKETLVSNDRPVEFVVFDGLHFTGANSTALSIHNSRNITVTNCRVDFSGVNGISVSSTPFFQLLNSIISYSMNNGVDLGQNTPHATIYNNLIECTNLFFGMGKSGNGNGVAIQASSSHNLIEQNKVINSGYTGIRFSGDSTVVKNNLIDNFCLTKDDGAGIYTWTGSSKEKHVGRKVIGNIVVNGIGVNEGTPSAKINNPPAEGIYLDDYASGIEIRDNTVGNVKGKGIFIHNARDLVIENNTVYNNGHQIYILQDAPDFPTRNNVIMQNLLVSPNHGQTNLTIRTNQDDIPLLASFEENRHLNFSDVANIYINKVIDTKLSVSEFYDLASWQGKYPNSDLEYDNIPGSRFEVLNVLSPNLLKNGSFDSNVDGAHCFSSGDNCLGEWSGRGIMDDGSLKVTAKGLSFLLMGFGEVKRHKNYVLRFSALADKATSLNIFLRQSFAPYHPISTSMAVLIGDERKEYEVLFSFPVSEQHSSIVFESGAEEQLSFWLDNVSLHEAEVSNTNMEQILFIYNHSASKSRHFLNGHYQDSDNKVYQKSFTLDPFSSLVGWPRIEDKF